MTAVATQPKAGLEGKKIDRKPVWRCQFCAMGHHGSCPRATRQTVSGNVVLWKCRCPEDGHPGLHCLDCKNEEALDINPETWTCYDRHSCATILANRRRHSRVWQMVQAAKSHSAIMRRAKRLGEEDALKGLDPTEDKRIEMLHAQFDKLEELRGKRPRKKNTKRSAPVRPKTGSCECCGEPTRGGRFLPGHDAKLASLLKQRVRDGDDEAYSEMKQRGWLKKLPASLIRAEDK